MLFLIRIKQVARALACARAIARIKWRRLDIGIFWGKKIRQEKLTKFTKILNYIKFSRIFVCKCLDISIIYISYSYKKNQHILVQRYWQITVLGHFELYQVFTYVFCVSKCLDIPIIYCLQKESTNFGYRDFWSIKSFCVYFSVAKCLDTLILYTYYWHTKCITQ